MLQSTPTFRKHLEGITSRQRCAPFQIHAYCHFRQEQFLYEGASTYTYGLQRPRDTLLTKATTNGECFY